MNRTVGTGIKVEARSKYQADVPAFTGRHLWVVAGAWAVAEPARSRFDLDTENLLTLNGPGCFYCEQFWHATISARCPGESGESTT